MAWNFELTAGPFKGRTGGLAWDDEGMLFSAVSEERVLRYDPDTKKADTFRRWTGRVNGLAVVPDGSVYAAPEGGRRVAGKSSAAPLAVASCQRFTDCQGSDDQRGEDHADDDGSPSPGAWRRKPVGSGHDATSSDRGGPANPAGLTRFGQRPALCRRSKFTAG